MQKSMVHELNPLVASNVQYSRSSFIHTVYQTDFNELRKSRIQNLPNYRKQDLSSKLNFVVVFQGIEIERLSVEIETLRVKIKDYERQLCNYQNYEVQIRQLTEKCHSYEMQRQDHQQAMQKMHKICQQLYNQLEQMRARYADIDLSLKEKYRLQKQRSEMLTLQIQKWKARHNASQTSKAKELDDMRMMLQNQRKSMLQREMREMSVKYESQRSMLQNQLRKVRQNLQNRNSELARSRQQLEQSRVREGQMRQYEARLDEYEDKLMMMAQQNMRLNELLRMKKEEIEQLKNNQRNLQNRLQNFSKIQKQFQLVTKKLQGQETDLRDWNQKYSRLQADNNRNLILSNKAQQYERLLDNSAQEMEKMNAIIREKIAQIDKYKTMNQRLMVQLEESRSTQEKVHHYELHLQEITNQNQRLSDQLRSRLEDVQNWKAKCSQMQAKLPLLSQTQDQCKNLKEKLAVQVTTRSKLSDTISALEKDLGRAADMEQTLIKERGVNKDLQRQVQRLNGSIRNLSSQNSDWMKKVQSLELQLKQSSGILEQLEQCKRKINMMTQQLDRINGLIHQKLQQIKQLKQNYNSVSINTARYKQIQEQFVVNLQQTQKLVLKLDEYRRENQCLNDKLVNTETRSKKLQSEIFTNNEQKEKLISILNQKKTELSDLVTRIQNADQRIAAYQVIEQQHKTLKTNYAQLQQKYTELQNRNIKEAKRSQQFSNQVETLTVEIMKLKNQSNFSKQFISEFANLKTMSEQKDKVITSLIQRLAIVQKCIQSAKQANKNNFTLTTQHNDKLKCLSGNFQLVSGFMDKFVELQSKVDALSDENFKLESNVNMISIDLAESRYASQNSYKNDDHRIHVSSPKSSMYNDKTRVLSPLSFQKQSLQSQSRQAVSHRIVSGESLSPSSKLSTIEQGFSNKQFNPIYQPQLQNSNYYQSQVRQLYGNSDYPSNMYTNNTNSFHRQQQNTNSFHRQQQGGYQQQQQQQQRLQKVQQPTTVQYTSKMMRPGSSHQSTSTYSYSSSYGNSPNYGSSYRVVNNPSSESITMSNANNPNNNNFMDAKYGSTINSTNAYTTFSNAPHTGSHLNNHFGQVERPASSFVKHSSKYSVSEVKNPINEQSQHTTEDTRRYMQSPARYL